MLNCSKMGPHGSTIDDAIFMLTVSDPKITSPTSILARNISVLRLLKIFRTKKHVKIKTFHKNNIYDSNERIEFILSNSYGFTAKNMYLNSLINSGLILKIYPYPLDQIILIYLSSYSSIFLHIFFQKN